MKSNSIELKISIFETIIYKLNLNLETCYLQMNDYGIDQQIVRFGNIIRDV